eukprot:7838328-Karenia_brevis.AAC.1
MMIFAIYHDGPCCLAYLPRSFTQKDCILHGHHKAPQGVNIRRARAAVIIDSTTYAHNMWKTISCSTRCEDPLSQSCFGPRPRSVRSQHVENKILCIFAWWLVLFTIFAPVTLVRTQTSGWTRMEMHAGDLHLRIPPRDTAGLRTTYAHLPVELRWSIPGFVLGHTLSPLLHGQAQNEPTQQAPLPHQSVAHAERRT